MRTFGFAAALLFASAALATSTGALAQAVTVSVYSASLDGGLMANGGRYRHARCTLAHRSLPFGTLVRMTNPRNGRTVVAPVTDRGPFVRGRTYDLSGRCARQLGVSGTPRLDTAIVSRPAWTAYARMGSHRHRHAKRGARIRRVKRR